MSVIADNKLTYDNAELKQAIIAYNNESDTTLKNDIFNGVIYESLKQVAYGILTKYCRHKRLDWDTMAQDIITYLWLHIDHCNIENGTIFQWCNVVASHYIWNLQKKNRNISLDDEQGIESIDDILLSTIMVEDNFKENDELTKQELVKWKEFSDYIAVHYGDNKVYGTIINRIQDLLDGKAPIKCISLRGNSRFPIRENIANSECISDKKKAGWHLEVMLRKFEQHRITEDGNRRVFEDGSSKVTEQSSDEIHAEIQISP